MLNAFHRHRPRRDRAHPSGVVPAAVSEDPPGEAESVETLDRCDAYVVLVADPVTGALDSYGPLPGPEALAEAARRRQDLDRGDLTDVAVEVVRHHNSTLWAG